MHSQGLVCTTLGASSAIRIGLPWPSSAPSSISLASSRLSCISIRLGHGGSIGMMGGSDTTVLLVSFDNCSLSSFVI